MPDAPDPEIQSRYASVADGFTRRLRGVEPDQWGQPSPCAEWTARDVVTHVIDTHRRVLGTLGEEEPEGAGDDLGAEWADVHRRLEAALADPERAGRTVGGLFGEQPFQLLVGRLLCADTLVHTWDLARATDQDEQLDADAVGRAFEFLTPIDEAIRRPGGFDAKIEPAPGADHQTEFLNFCGRAV